MDDRLIRYAVWAAILITLLLLLNELGYYWWRRLNPGEHWSHLQGMYNPIVEYPPPPRADGTLNNQRRTF